MSFFKPGDLVQRKPEHQANSWWRTNCTLRNIKADQIFTVLACDNKRLICKEWVHTNSGQFIRARPEYFVLVTTNTQKLIEQRINKLYSKCKTTAHWSK